MLWVFRIAQWLYALLLPVGWIALVGVVVLFLPLGLVRRTRPLGATLLVLASWLFGLITWLLGVMATYGSWGTDGLAFGLLVGVVGVVPIGILGSFVKLHSTAMGISLCVMCAVTYGARVLGAYLAALAENATTESL